MTLLLPWPNSKAVPPNLPGASVGLIDWILSEPVATCWEERVAEVGRRVKLARTNLTSLLYQGEEEARVLGVLEVQQEARLIERLWEGVGQPLPGDTIEEGEGAAQIMARVVTGLEDYRSRVEQVDIDSPVGGMVARETFRTGLEHFLEPWLVKGEQESRQVIGRPNSFAEARDTERVCVAYAKEVRKINKVVTRLDEVTQSLTSNKASAEQQLEEQKGRFRKVAGVAAGRVQGMRDLLIRWSQLGKSEDQDFQPLTQFLRCYSLYFHPSRGAISCAKLV